MCQLSHSSAQAGSTYMTRTIHIDRELTECSLFQDEDDEEGEPKKTKMSNNAKGKAPSPKKNAKKWACDPHTPLLGSMTQESAGTAEFILYCRPPDFNFWPFWPLTRWFKLARFKLGAEWRGGGGERSLLSLGVSSDQTENTSALIPCK